MLSEHAMRRPGEIGRVGAPGKRHEQPGAIRQETWRGGSVVWSDGHRSSAGLLVNLGEKLQPLQPFLRYSGLWGSPGVTYINSGYWGPAYNETSRREDGFIEGWCGGAADPEKAHDGIHECYPDDLSE